ncbi:hypothetical protein CkaCkLH20_01602 [Colletotrichum karsti]|uniref:Uncharacterized protein n=1 Tax=Colletotrichum karsti TaxID=1095194 RepID=A0A9P6LP93_9PEZI|nr:uncharacterized protein CkaCkLH20_01602 [Colletotrichum karsti]KAF9880560.1 hypothetical protein CkaCkLH20_01602 [Colletotrichum karsti]
MPKSQFIPARSSRHRIAVIALFRALLREGRSINLPKDVHRKGRSPVAELVKRGFERNKADVSPRLVFAALSAGYKFLTFFKNAQTEGSNEHNDILAYLREKNKLIARAEAKQRPRRKPRQLKPDYKPLLQKVSKPDEPPEYISPIFPRPRDSFKGRRKIPHLIATASQHVFLRHKRGPQPLAVGHVLRRKQARKVKLDETMLDLKDDMLFEARSEDTWDRIVEETLRENGAGKEESMKRNDGPPPFKYADSISDSYEHLSNSITTWRAEEVAKMKTLVEAVRGEEELLAQEVEEAKQYGVRIIPTELERIKPYLAHRKARKTKKRLGIKQRKVKRWQSRFVGLQPDPIKK